MRRPPTPSELDRGFPGGAFGAARRWTAADVRRDQRDIHRFAAWPVAAEASSQWGQHGSWWARQCVGRPDVWPAHGDRTGAWAPGAIDGRAEWIEVRFDPAPAARAIRVFETNGAGAAYAVAIDAGTGWEVIWVAKPIHVPGTACLLEVDLPEPRHVERARVWVDGSLQDSWAEIDTVALLCVEEVVAPSVVAPAEDVAPTAAVGRGRRYSAREMARVDPEVDARGLWPVAARASSEFSSSWGAEQLIGRPKVWPDHGDRRGAWAPRSSRSGVEWIEVDFASGDMPTRAIRVFETNVAGSTVRVSIVTGDEERVVFEAPAVSPRLTSAQVLEIELDALAFVKRLRCYVDNSAGGWSEIDSVAILPVPRADPYRGLGPGGRTVARPTLHDELMRGFAGRRTGDGRRYGVFAMLAHDWQVGWRGAWPVRADASSSYGGAWSAGAATGKPSIYPLSGDLPGNWAPRAPKSGVEWLEVDFGRSVLASGVRVFETRCPGAVFALVAEGDPGGTPVLLWSDAPFEGDGADVLEVLLREPMEIRRVRAYLDNGVGPSWVEIDTIGLLKA